MTNLSKRDKLAELVVGKTVDSVEYWETGICIRFTDGTEVNIRASGSEEVWINVEEL